MESRVGTSTKRLILSLSLFIHPVLLYTFHPHHGSLPRASMWKQQIFACVCYSLSPPNNAVYWILGNGRNPRCVHEGERQRKGSKEPETQVWKGAGTCPVLEQWIQSHHAWEKIPWQWPHLANGDTEALSGEFAQGLEVDEDDCCWLFVGFFLIKARKQEEEFWTGPRNKGWHVMRSNQ